MGALLDFLTRERATGELGDVEETAELNICNIEVLALYGIFPRAVRLAQHLSVTK